MVWLRVNLLPFSSEPDDLEQYLDYNFKRISDVLTQQDNVTSGLAVVTGSLVISTGMAVVRRVVASLNTVPTATGCFVRAIPSGTDITIYVYDNAFVLSTVAKNVEWIATGVF